MELREILMNVGRGEYVDCPLCNTGKYGGTMAHCCDNPECDLHASYWMQKCGDCGEIRKECKCKAEGGE